jgi:hypothetical protein
VSEPPALPGADEAARELADALESHGVEYAIGGALALAQWGVVRGTHDVDVNLWLDPARPTEAASRVAELGCEFQAAGLIREWRDKGWGYVHFKKVRVDVYLPVMPFHESARARRRRASLLGRGAWFLSPEDLAVFKLILYRTKDRADLEGLLVVRGSEFDRRYVREWICGIAGENDLRVSGWDELTAAADDAIRLRQTGWKPSQER